MNCKICGTQSNEFDSANILGKYKVRYYHCSKCDFVQTEEPYWINEAYSGAFASIDTGTMTRNMQNSTNLLFFMKYIEDGPCLDFGGAYGVLTRMMRDYGFDFYNYDKYAQNLFASGFDGDLTKEYALVTSFENFEHFVNPLEEIDKIFNITETLYFTTFLLPKDPPPIQSWWYYALDTGQHISFYSKKTLEYIVNKYGMYLISDNVDTHILSKKKINSNFIKRLRLYNRINNRINISRYFKKPSKTMEDMEKNINLNKLKYK
jgi:hypothetical protein